MRYTIDVGPGDSGIRVTIRRRLPEGGLGDVLGQLLSWTDGVLTVQRRDGTNVTIDEQDVVAAKRIPPAPERR
ncbi:MAG: hypothetical protein JWM40_543 [Frankiales bacterium]|nr:hypothetical protein [Frankiales bacterium]